MQEDSPGVVRSDEYCYRATNNDRLRVHKIPPTENTGACDTDSMLMQFFAPKTEKHSNQNPRYDAHLKQIQRENSLKERNIINTASR